MLDFITTLVEYQRFGWNATTITSSIIIGLSLFQGWGTLIQNRRIKRDQSGEGLSVRWFAYTMFFFVAAVVYGVYAKSAAMLVNATILALLHLIILTNLWRFKRWTKTEIAHVACYATMPIILGFATETPVTIGSLTLPGKDIAFLIFSFGTIYAVATQPLEMWRTKTVGVVEIKLLFVHIVAVTFWGTYAFYIDAIALQILNPALFVIFVATIGLWFLYRKKDPVAA